jgi:deoxyadenosine/deoxycytidine kinase
MVFTYNLIKSGKFPEEYVPIYDQFWNMLASPMASHIKAMVYLDVSPEICMERMRRRNRSEESGVPLEYLNEIGNFHDGMIAGCDEDGIRSHRIDWNSDMAADDNMMKDLESRFRDIVDGIVSEWVGSA